MSVKAYKEEDFNRVIAKYVDVIGEKLGGKVLEFSDEWFAAAENLIKPNPPIREVGKFTPAGAWYDGWETRRHNPEPADWVVVQLGVASARIIGAEIDTAFFNGNHAPAISVQGAFLTEKHAKDHDWNNVEWEDIIPTQPCGPSQRHFFLRDEITEVTYTHIRLNMFPDGGIARFRLYGTPNPVFSEDINAVIDLAHVSSGGVAIARSDQHFGSADNLLLPGRGVNMGDGWETSRSRTKGHIDWVIVRLGAVGYVDKVVVDTIHFLGNFPKSFEVHGLLTYDKDGDIEYSDRRWTPIVPETLAGPNKEHVFEGEELTNKPQDKFSHVRLTIIPDGGVKRLRIFGRRAPEDTLKF